MSTHKNVIEINGKLYDAKSGLLLGGSIIRPKASASIDGVFSAKPPQQSIKSTVEQKPVIANKPKSITRPAKSRPKPMNISRRAPQRSHTLMRRVVKKPIPAPKPAAIQVAKHSAVHHGRLTRAQSIEKNPYIRKFNDVDHHQPVHKRVEPLTVKAAPKPVIKEHKPVPQPSLHHKIAPKPQSKSEQLFHEALQKVTAEEPKKHKKHKIHKRKARRLGSRALRWGSASLAALLLAGFIGYMNLTNINLQLASARAGFDAELPRYLPSGYNVKGPISYQPGKITINFTSNTDQRNYSLTQEVSQWNSTALQEYLAVREKKFDTVQEAGRTIYLFDNGNATWVNGGVWYVIESKSLSSNQLIKVASSL